MGPFVPQLSRYEDRIKLTPVNGGSWAGVRGESNFVFDNPDLKKILPNGIAYKNGYPDFSPIALQEVRLSGLISTDRDVNFRAANQMLANKLRKRGQIYFLDAGRDLAVASQAEVDTYEYRRKGKGDKMEKGTDLFFV